MKKLVAALVLVASMGCAGSVNGTVGGVNLSVSDAIFSLFKDSAGKTTGAFIVLSDKPNLCASLKANREPKSATALSLVLFRFSNTDYLAPDVGDYTVTADAPTSAGSFAQAQFSRTDANCTNTLNEATSYGKSGLVKVANLKGETNGNASGTFDLTFGAGDKVTGTFNANFCDVTMIASSPNCE